MQFPEPLHLVVRRTGEPPSERPITAGGQTLDGDIAVDVASDCNMLQWSVANRGDRPVALDAVALGWREGAAGKSPRLFSNGYQSWSPTGTRALGVDTDPSRAEGSIPFLRAMHHADPSVAPAGELRSEQVTVIDPGTGAPLRCVGFLGGANHAGTLRARLVDGSVEVRAEAWLGGAVLAPCERRVLHSIMRTEGDDAPALLDGWAAVAGRAEAARAFAPYQVGWCSWYHYFHGITEEALDANLARAGDWPFDVFQLDDGFQAAIGDWLEVNDRFPSGLERIAGRIAAAGRTPGLWLAPFLAAPASRLARTHPEWMARDLSGEPLVGMWHEVWGGFMWELDTTLPEVQEHLASVAASLVDRGYRYLKLDFTFSPAVPGRFSDPARTPAERVRLGYEAVRRGAGEEVVIVACGCPLSAVVGVVDAMRIGPDVAPSWNRMPTDAAFPGYERAAPATRHAYANTLARAFQHRRLWLNDPDCLMLRPTDTRLSADEARTWALAVGVSGGLALVSDDLSLLDGDARRLLDEVITIGRTADEAARTGPAPRCSDLLERPEPSRLAAAGYAFGADPAAPKPDLGAPTPT